MRAAALALALALGSCGDEPEPADRPRPPRTPETEPGTESVAAGEAGASETGEGGAPEPTSPGSGPVRIELDLAARLVLRIAEHDEHLDAERIDARTIRLGARTADVSALEALCATEPGRCEDAIDAWAERLARPVDAATESSLSAILVPSAEVDAARASAREAGLPEPIVGRPWTPPFFLALVSVEPDVLRQLEAADLTALGGRDEAALEAIALGNLEELPPFEHEPASLEHAPNVRVMTLRDGLATSRLLLRSRWDELAASVHGRLVVSVPTAETILFTGDATALDVATLAYLSRRTFLGQPSPVSPAILRLGADGWSLDSPNDRPDPDRDSALEAVYGRASP